MYIYMYVYMFLWASLHDTNKWMDGRIIHFLVMTHFVHEFYATF